MVDIPIPKDTPSWPEFGTHWPKFQRIEYIKQQGYEIGFYALCKTELSKKLGVDRKQIYKDLDEIYRAGVDPNTIAMAKIEYDSVNRVTMAQLLKDFKVADIRDRPTIARAIIEIQKANTEFLEKFGIKEISPLITDTTVEVKFTDNLLNTELENKEKVTQTTKTAGP